jgi:AcrR family transcriptional regulator
MVTQVRLSREKRRQLLIEAAERVARQHGVYNVTHRSVANECVVQTSIITVKKYFPTKAEILAAVAERDVTGLVAAEIEGMK